MNNQIILSIYEFNEISKGIKAVKSDYCCVYCDKIYGIDSTFSKVVLYQLPFRFIYPPFIIFNKTLNKEFYNNITDINVILDFNISKIYCPNNKKYAKTIDSQMVSWDMNNNTINKIQGLLLEKNSGKIIDFGDITTDFEVIKSLKSADGAKPYNPKGNIEYTMYLFSGALPLNKSDTISLKIYDISNNIFISEFTVDKKKIGLINVYFKFIKLGRV